ncbi:DUF3263 domain-containing protein [Plantactinospora solaniradicis]|uniref:DUF3263 domain-containing protein n=1 Tax=Plantactinospora solaniradicis TaxID=1723736 RepID=A0ABW1K268_9ACTN
MRNASAPADDDAADDDVADREVNDVADHEVGDNEAADGEVGDDAAVVGRPGRGAYVPQPRSAPASGSDEPPEPPVPAPAGAPALSEREREILAFERRWWKHAGAKEQAIRDAFDLSSTRYYQLLNGLLDNPAALAAEPMLVARLRRLRAARSRNRRR